MSVIMTVFRVGSSSEGQDFTHEVFRNGGFLRRIGVWAGRSELRGIRIWFTDSPTPQTYGTANVGTYSEYTFADDERITSLSLWGNGIGTRSGGVRIRTSRPGEFFAHMTSWSLRQEFAIDVASGLCVGVRGRHNVDICQLAFVFLLPIARSRMINMSYPNLPQGSQNIQVERLREERDFNESNLGSRLFTYNFSQSITRTSEWSMTTGLQIHSSVTVSGGIPSVAEVSGQFGWVLSASTTFGTRVSETDQFGWTREVEVAPRSWLHFLATHGRGSISTAYEATIEMTVVTGATFTYTMRGTYSGVSYTKTDVKTETGPLASDFDSTTASMDTGVSSRWIKDKTSSDTTITLAVIEDPRSDFAKQSFAQQTKGGVIQELQLEYS